jgi:DNA-directed RNA polymerase specialized sigma24 family protein
MVRFGGGCEYKHGGSPQDTPPSAAPVPSGSAAGPGFEVIALDTTKSFDREHVSRLLAGSAEDIRRAIELMEEHLRGRLCGWLRKLFPGLAADDLGSAWADTLVAVLKAARAGRFDPDRPLMPWLCRIAHCRAVDYTRRETCRTEALEAAAYDLGRTLEGRHWNGLPPAEQHEVLRLIHEAVETLRGNQRKVLRDFVNHYPESADPDVLRWVVALTTSKVLTPAAIKRAFQEGRVKVRAYLRRKGYSLDE